MLDEKGTGIGFLRSTKARHAEEAIGHSEGLVTVLRLTQADIKPAEDALTIAKQFYGAHQYSKAVQAAKRAEALAIKLDDRFNGYQKAVKDLASQVESMKRFGLPTESLEAVLGRAEERILAGVWEDGAFVPNYLEARSLLDRATREGRDHQEKAEVASNRIFAAELAIEALSNLTTGPNPEGPARSAAADLEQTLHDATRELALGNAEGAGDIAKDLEEKATRLMRLSTDATKTLDATDEALANLRSEGVLTQALEDQVRMARDMLARGIIEPGSAMASRLRGEAKSIGDTSRKATTALADAEILYSRLQREGFHSYEADAALRDARRSIREGSYVRAIEHLERALQAFARRSNARAALAKAIEETRTRVRLMRGNANGLSFMPDIQEVLARAEREFHQGNYSGSSEDLRIATVLLDEVTRAPMKR